MIRTIRVNDVATEIETSFTTEVKTYNIVTGYMSDDCKPYRLAQSAMLWLSDKGEIGELECIYPRIVEVSPCQFSEQVSYREGFPELEITEENLNVCVQHHEEGYTIWFAKEKVIDSQLNMQDTIFLLSGNELVGIACKNVTVI